MNKNVCSKFKYQNSYQVKYSVNPYTGNVSTLNTEIKTIKPNIGHDILDTGIHFNIGETVIVDNIYSCTQVTCVDEPVLTNKSPIKKIFFKLFKLS